MTETNRIYSKNKQKKRKDTVLGTKKWHITTAGIIKIKESYELHADNLKKTISQSVTGIDKVQQVNESQIRQGLRQVEFKFYLEGNKALAGI